ncbi:uncharacterized protein LOC117813717 [Notolabrus celidotus]|uniref:uncharacterized protein LOC117813717 n=1 Tax=Notolabrus celidotus TaxID=1203425 RepID=UPI0014907374|nr:uncharacterized protein LOC117813717 [Notolabrus celidotus]
MSAERGSERNAMIQLLFNNGFKQREISSMLASFGHKISERHLRRVLQLLGLRRRSHQRPITEIQNAVESEIRHCSPEQGIRAMLRRVRDVRGVRPCYRDDVAKVMRDLDASGLQRRSPGKKKIQRRNYISCGPNDTWHIDGNDKLKFFGMWIHLGIDGFSRKVLWLKVGTSNRKQRFVARYFYDAVQEHGGCPQLIRSDRGKENLVVGQMQMAFHMRELGNQAWKCFRMGTSVHNQRAECFNSILKRTWIKKWLTTFEAMMESGILELDNPVHINCLQYTHLLLFQEELETERALWNTHDIRKQRHAPGPFGKPDLLYTSPPPGFAEMLYTVDTDLLDHAKDIISEKDEPSMVANSEFREMCQIILGKSQFPRTVEGCLAAYLMVVKELTTAMTRNTLPTPSTFAEANEMYKFLNSGNI